MQHPHHRPWLLPVALSLALTSCAEQETASVKILNGEASHESNVVEIVKDGSSTLCTGVVLGNNSDLILTAGHCLRMGLSGGEFLPRDIVFNRVKIKKPGSERLYAIRNYHVEPFSFQSDSEGFLRLKSGFDLALIRTKENTGVPPATLASPDLNPDQIRDLLTPQEDREAEASLLAVGYGGMQRPPADRTGTQNARLLQFRKFFPEGTELYAGNTQFHVCPGDSGGPLFMQWNGKKQVLGITSRSKVFPFAEICGGSDGSIFTNVAAPEVRAFLGRASEIVHVDPAQPTPDDGNHGSGRWGRIEAESFTTAIDRTPNNVGNANVDLGDRNDYGVDLCTLDGQDPQNGIKVCWVQDNEYLYYSDLTVPDDRRFDFKLRVSAEKSRDNKRLEVTFIQEDGTIRTPVEFKGQGWEKFVDANLSVQLKPGPLRVEIKIIDPIDFDWFSFE